MRQQKFLVDNLAGRSENRPSATFGHISYRFEKFLNLDQKQKRYGNLKVAYSKNSKNMVALPHLKVNRTIRQVYPEMLNGYEKYECN